MADTEAPDSVGGTAPAPRRGALNLMTIIASAVAVLALAICGILFMQLSKAQGALKHAALPEGLKGGEAAAGEGAETAPAMMSEPQEVTYELGDFTANTKDGKFVKLSLALAIKSFYLQDDWDNYQLELEQYNEQRKHYFDFQREQAQGAKGKTKANLEEEAPTAEGVLQADYRPAGMQVIPAEEHKKEEPPALPEKEPVRPLTRLELALKDDDSKVRSIVNNEINDISASELISPEGKAQFKKKVIDAFTAEFDSTLGTVEDIYFKNIVTT
jgi:flagellar basal body-associated protein FliL